MPEHKHDRVKMSTEDGLEIQIQQHKETGRLLARHIKRLEAHTEVQNRAVDQMISKTFVTNLAKPGVRFEARDVPPQVNRNYTNVAQVALCVTLPGVYTEELMVKSDFDLLPATILYEKINDIIKTAEEDMADSSEATGGALASARLRDSGPILSLETAAKVRRFSAGVEMERYDLAKGPPS